MHLIPFSAHKRTTLHRSRRICRLYWQDVSQNFSWLRRSLSEARTWSTARYLMSPEILSIPLRWKAWPEIWVSASMFCPGFFLKHSIKTSTSTWMMPGWDMHVSDLKIPMIQSRSSALTVDLKVCAPLTVRLSKSSKLPPVNTGKHLLEIGIWCDVKKLEYDMIAERMILWYTDGTASQSTLIWPDNICREDIRISGVSLDTEKKVSWSSRK